MFLCNISDIVLKLKYKSKSFKLNHLATILIFSLYVYIITFQSPQEKKSIWDDNNNLVYSHSCLEI